MAFIALAMKYWSETASFSISVAKARKASDIAALYIVISVVGSKTLEGYASVHEHVGSLVRFLDSHEVLGRGFQGHQKGCRSSLRPKDSYSESRRSNGSLSFGRVSRPGDALPHVPASLRMGVRGIVAAWSASGSTSFKCWLEQRANSSKGRSVHDPTQWRNSA